MWKLYFTTHSQFSFPFYPSCSVHVPNILHTYTYRQVHSLSFSRVFFQAAKRLLAIYAPSNSVCCLFAVSRAITLARWQQFLSSIDKTSSKSSKNCWGKLCRDPFSKSLKTQSNQFCISIPSSNDWQREIWKRIKMETLKRSNVSTTNKIRQLLAPFSAAYTRH